MVWRFRKTHTKNDVCIRPIADIANIDLNQIYPSKINKLALISVFYSIYVVKDCGIRGRKEGLIDY